MKKKIYIGLFVLLGALLSTIVHGALEWFYVFLLRLDFARYSMGLSYHDMVLIHSVLSILLLAGGLYLGYMNGKRCWQILYVEKRYGEPIL